MMANGTKLATVDPNRMNFDGRGEWSFVPGPLEEVTTHESYTWDPLTLEMSGTANKGKPSGSIEKNI